MPSHYATSPTLHRLPYRSCAIHFRPRLSVPALSVLASTIRISPSRSEPAIPKHAKLGHYEPSLSWPAMPIHSNARRIRPGQYVQLRSPPANKVQAAPDPANTCLYGPRLPIRSPPLRYSQILTCPRLLCLDRNHPDLSVTRRSVPALPISTLTIRATPS